MCAAVCEYLPPPPCGRRVWIVRIGHCDILLLVCKVERGPPTPTPPQPNPIPRRKFIITRNNDVSLLCVVLSNLS